MGSQYCDPTLGPVNCDAAHFGGFHLFRPENVFCPWNVHSSVPNNAVTCYDGKTGNVVNMPGSRRLMQRSLDVPRMLNYSTFLHVSQPHLKVELGI